MIKLCLTHLEVWAGCICREEELFQEGGRDVCALMLLPGKRLGCSSLWFQQTQPDLLAGAGIVLMHGWLVQDGISLLDISAVPLSLGSVQGDLCSAFNSSSQKSAFLEGWY